MAPQGPEILDVLVGVYGNRFRGLSIFSLAPISESSMVASSTLQQQMLQFESTESNHLPADASEMAKLSASWNTIPGTRHEAAAWVEHVGIMTRMLLGDACPMNLHFDGLQDSFAKTPLVRQLDRRRMEGIHVVPPHGVPGVYD
jgi:hypothetical protein